MEEYFQYLFLAIILLLFILTTLNYFFLKQILEIKKFTMKLNFIENIDKNISKILEFINILRNTNENTLKILEISHNSLKSLETHVAENESEIAKYKELGEKIYNEINQINSMLLGMKNEIDEMFKSIL